MKNIAHGHSAPLVLTLIAAGITVLLLPSGGDARHEPCRSGSGCGIRNSIWSSRNSGTAPFSISIGGDVTADSDYSGGFDMRLHCRTGPYSARCTSGSSCSTTCSYGDGDAPSQHIRHNAYIAGHVNDSHKDSSGKYITVNVSGGSTGGSGGTTTPTWDISLSATPTTGFAPVTSTLNATGSGTATGGIRWQTDCTNDGTWEQDITNTSTAYAFPCTYPAPGTFTAKVKSTREGLSRSQTIGISVSNPSPSVTVIAHAFCATGPQGTVSWTYSDPAGRPQAAFHVQIATDASFTNVISERRGDFLGSSTVTLSDVPPGERFFARASAANDLGFESAWSAAYAFFSPPEVRFSTVPEQLFAEEPFTAVDMSDYGSAEPSTWTWDMGDGTQYEDAPSVMHTYTESGEHTIVLTVTDSNGESCSDSLGSSVELPIPEFRESLPQ